MIVNRVLLATVLPATTTEDTRYFLRGIEVTNGGADVIAVATDGHVLIKASTKAEHMKEAEYPEGPSLPQLGPAERALVPADVAADLIKLTKKNSLPILRGARIGTDTAGRTIAAVTDLTTARTFDITPSPDSGAFPAWEKVMPRKPVAVHVSLGVPVLEKLIKAAKAGGAVFLNFEIPHDDPKAACVMDQMRVTWTPKDDADVSVEAVAMPVRQ